MRPDVLDVQRQPSIQPQTGLVGLDYRGRPRITESFGIEPWPSSKPLIGLVRFQTPRDCPIRERLKIWYKVQRRLFFKILIGVSCFTKTGSVISTETDAGRTRTPDRISFLVRMRLSLKNRQDTLTIIAIIIVFLTAALAIFNIITQPPHVPYYP